MIQLQEVVHHPIYTLGTLTAYFFAFRILRFILLYLPPPHGYGVTRYIRPNSWAIVTGATNGIGLELVHELAARGMNVILHGRNPAKMERIKRDFERTYPDREFRSLIADASDSQGFEKFIGAVVESLQDLPGELTMLINNCGGDSYTGKPLTPFAEYSPVEIDGLINLNLRFATQLTRSLVPRLTKDGPSLLINVSSLGGATGSPYYTVYSGAKAFTNFWTWSLFREFKAEGRGIECISMPLGTCTDAAGRGDPASLFLPGAKTVARAILARAGCGYPVVSPYWGHGVQEVLASWVPERIQAGYVLDTVRKGAALRRVEGKGD